MDSSAAPMFSFLFFLHSTLIVCSSGFFNSDHLLTQLQTLHWSRKDLLNFPTTTPAPTIVTVPSASTPVTVTPTPVTTPATNPVTTPTTPVTNPVTTPAVAPPATTTTAPASGQRWCVAKSGASEKSIQAALDYACGIGGADCSSIQQGASCYNPVTLQNHASFAFNSYYQRNPVPTSCDFGGAGAITTTNPSSGSCIFATSAASASPTTASPVSTNSTTTPATVPIPPTTASPVTMNPTPTPTPVPFPFPPTTASPVTMNPTPTPTPVPFPFPPTTASPVIINPTPTPTPTTSSSTGAAPIGSGTPPTILNASNPDFGGATTGGFGDIPPVANTTSSVSMSRSLQPFIGCIVAVASIVAGAIFLDM